jgi:hypothetical protein
MKKPLVVLGGLGAVLVACGGPFVAKTVAEAFAQFPGNHSIVVNANADVDVPLGGNEVVVVIGNANTFTVNGASVPDQVAGFINPAVTTGASASSLAPQAVCVTPTNPVARVRGTQTSFVLHMDDASRQAFKTAFDSLCQADGTGKCTNSAPAKTEVFTKPGSSVALVAGQIALRARRSDTAKGDPSAPFQSVNRVRFEPITTSGASVEDGTEIYRMDLNAASQIASPQCLPSTP